MKECNANVVNWFEIYVDNMDRAKSFYEKVLDIEMNEMPMPEGMGEMRMLAFPWVENAPNASGALVKAEGMKAGSGGTLIYFYCDDCALEESRVEAAGGKIFQSKFSIGDYGFCAVVADSEGNSIGLHSMK